MEKHHRYIGEAVEVTDDGRLLLKFKIMQDGIWYGTLNPIGAEKWGKFRGLKMPAESTTGTKQKTPKKIITQARSDENGKPFASD
ncbi:hypothetical protein [Thermoactinomyces sp. CICC 23799]|jgi:hypothetical protein|uniref:hypothetical protein n=1 Tax=Thermoactinomyces sp. CICC 23799 TaxID=2767429 RepID=UPI0018DBA702|nr:hypothetical protein [Thermoactinomyces sp. CICC 23799]MBH8601486.1 hypothetical protein [Thermoactinomyces sp. CICC 23799]